MVKQKMLTARIVANHTRISMAGQLCQNAYSSMMMRFKDTHSAEGIAKAQMAIVLV